MREELYFVFDGRTSKEMGLINVNLDSGLFEEQFMAEQTIEEESVRGNDVPYFSGTTRTPYTISFSFAFENGFTEDRLNDVANWLGNQPYYKELYFSNNIDKRYFMMYTGSPSIFHNGLEQGYINIDMRSISSYAYSPVLVEGELNLSNIGAMGENITIENRGNITTYPVLEIQKVGNGSVEIINYSQAENSSFKINNLIDREKVIVDCESEDIISDVPLTYHFDDVVGKYLSFVKGANYLTIKGNCLLTIKYRCIFNNLK